MSYNPVIWMILIGSVLAIDVYNEMPPGDFDYEMENAMDGSPYSWLGSNQELRARDAEDLRRNMILLKLMKTMQDDPESFYKADYAVDPNPEPMPNNFETIELRPPFAKRSSNSKEDDTNTKPTNLKAAAKPRPRKQPNSRRRAQRPRPQPKQQPKKIIYPMCYLKLCEFKLPQL